MPVLLLLLSAFLAATEPTIGERLYGVADEIPGTVVVDHDWGDPGIMELFSNEGRGAVSSGTIPRGGFWWENSLFDGNRVTYGIVSDQGESYTNIHSEITGKPERFIQLRIRDGAWPARSEATAARVQLRFRGPPGHGWEIRVGKDRRFTGHFPGGFGWVNLDEKVRLPAGERSFMFLIFPHGPGPQAIDIGLRRVRIEEIPIPAFQAAVERRFAEGYPANLLDSTRFPLGESNGLHTRKTTASALYARLEGDPTTIGPSGCPAAKVTSTAERLADLGHWHDGKFNNYLEVYTPAFPVPRTTTHVLSFWVKGRGTISARVAQVWDDVGPSVQRVLTGDEGWQRLAVTFTPRLLADPPHHGRLYVTVAKGDALWLDAFQVEEGTTPTPYTTHHPAEVSLALADSRDGIFFDGQPASLAWAASGDLAKGRLQIEVTDTYRQTRRLPPVALGEGRYQTGRLPAADLTGRPQDVLRVVGWIERDGASCSPPAEAIIGKVRQPRHWDAFAPDSPFGVHCELDDGLMGLSKKIGFNWRREWGLFRWNTAQRKADQPFQIPALEWDAVARIQAHKQLSMPILIGPPAWAADDLPGLTPGTSQLPREGAFRQYAHDLVAHLNGRVPGLIRLVEVWNEPYFPQVYLQQGTDPATGRQRVPQGPEISRLLLRLHQEAYAGVKSADPQVAVAGICGSIEPAYQGFIRKVIAEQPGLLAFMDLVSYHDYDYSDGRPGGFTQTSILATAGGLVRPDGAALPLMMTEGIPNQDATRQGLLRSTIPMPLPADDWDRAADIIARWNAATLASGVQRIFAYSLRAHGFLTKIDRGHSTFTDDLGNLHPTGLAMAASAWHLEGMAPAGQVDLVAGRIGAWLFAARPGGGRTGSVAVIVRREGDDGPAPALTPPARVLLTDLYGNPLAAGATLGETTVYLSLEAPAKALPAALAATLGR